MWEVPWPLSEEEGAGNLVCPTRAGSALHGQVLAASHARYPTGTGVLDLGAGPVEGTRPGVALSRDSWRALGDPRTPAGAVAPDNGPPLPTAGGEGATNLRVTRFRWPRPSLRAGLGALPCPRLSGFLGSPTCDLVATDRGPDLGPRRCLTGPPLTSKSARHRGGRGGGGGGGGGGRSDTEIGDLGDLRRGRWACPARLPSLCGRVGPPQRPTSRSPASFGGSQSSHCACAGSRRLRPHKDPWVAKRRVRHALSGRARPLARLRR